MKVPVGVGQTIFRKRGKRSKGLLTQDLFCSVAEFQKNRQSWRFDYGLPVSLFLDQHYFKESK